MEKKISYAIHNIQHTYHSSMNKKFYFARIAWIPGFNRWEEQIWNIEDNLLGM